MDGPNVCFRFSDGRIFSGVQNCTTMISSILADFLNIVVIKGIQIIQGR